jgi:DNA-binding MarR family transcriptional regulator
MEIDWKEDQKAPLSLYFSFLAKQYIGAMISTLAHVELERYFVVLLVIDQNGETFTQQNLADYFGIDKASVVRVVGYLTEKGLIRRQVNSRDRREYFLVLTEKGKALVPDIRQSIQGLNKKALNHLTSEQTEQFFRSLNIIRQNLSEVPSEEVRLQFQKTSYDRQKKRFVTNVQK